MARGKKNKQINLAAVYSPSLRWIGSVLSRNKVTRGGLGFLARGVHPLCMPGDVITQYSTHTCAPKDIPELVICCYDVSFEAFLQLKDVSVDFITLINTLLWRVFL